MDGKYSVGNPVNPLGAGAILVWTDLNGNPNNTKSNSNYNWQYFDNAIKIKRHGLGKK